MQVWRYEALGLGNESAAVYQLRGGSVTKGKEVLELGDTAVTKFTEEFSSFEVTFLGGILNTSAIGLHSGMVNDGLLVTGTDNNHVCAGVATYFV